MALGMDRGDGPDTPILQALAGLGERIRDFGREVDGEQAWVPDRWRGVLTPDAFNPPRAWPWPDDRPGRLHPAPGTRARRSSRSGRCPRTRSRRSGSQDIEGGFSSLSLTGPDGKLYLFALRPLFPDESY